MQTLTINLSRWSLTRTIDQFRLALQAEIDRMSAEDGITLNTQMVTKVLLTLETISDMTLAHHA